VELEFTTRACPVCGATSGREIAAARLDTSTLDEFAFASRKFPEYMHPRYVECDRCNVAYADPVLAAAGLESAYDHAAFDSKEEAEYASRTYQGLLPRLRSRLPRSPTALDIGTGEGSFLDRLLDSGFSHVRGVEPSAAAIAAASDRVRPLIAHGVFDRETLGDEQFDLVTCFQTIEHVAAPAELCRDAFAAVAPGGAFLLVCHDRGALLNRKLKHLSPIMDVEHLQLFTRRSARELLARAGFVDISVDSFSNRYPLHYWLKLAPVPRRLKEAMVSGARRGPLGALTISLPVGNLAVVGYRPADERA
jgi:SAM-dependent methyltransferase